MFRLPKFLIVASLACGLLLATASSADARNRGGGRGGASRGYSSGYRGGYYGGYRGGYYGRRDGGWGFYGPGIALGLGAYPYYYGSRSYYYSPDTSYYVEPSVIQPSTSYYVEPSAIQPSGYVEPSVTPSTGVTRLRVILPDPNATVWFDGFQSTVSGSTRTFEFPDEGAGKAYLHKMKATWRGPDGKQMTQEREVRVQGAATATVDFTRKPGGSK